MGVSLSLFSEMDHVMGSVHELTNQMGVYLGVFLYSAKKSGQCVWFFQGEIFTLIQT